MGVKIAAKLPKSTNDNGLHSLAEPMATTDGIQFMVAMVRPKRDVRTRGPGGDQTTEVEIMHVEGLPDADHRLLAQRLLLDARRARLGHVEEELPLDDGDE